MGSHRRSFLESWGRWLLMPGLVWALLLALLSGCAQVQETPAQVALTIEADGQQIAVLVPQGSSVQQAVAQANIVLTELDRVEPPSYTTVSPGQVVRVTRVREVFTIEEIEIPFERKTLNNETLPEGSKPLLVQNGQNGREQVTYRQVFEDDREVSKTIFQREVIVEPQPEIQMVGVQQPFTPVTIPGRIAYLAGSSAWVMETSTGNRRPAVTSGDLDGRVFALSPKGDWLLFTRQEQTQSQEGTVVNSLWAVDISEEGTRPVSLRVQNVIAAYWVPEAGLTVAYSTFEPSAAAPGWKANNDLLRLTFSSTGAALQQTTLIEANYGWFGSSFLWSPDGQRLAYARPHEIGLVDLATGQLNPLVKLTYYQTGEGWEWVPGAGWSPDSRSLYFVNHAPKAGLVDQETSPLFDLAAVPLGESGGVQAAQVRPLIPLVPQAGMFAYPSPAPGRSAIGYQVAYLRAIFPEQSDNRYRLMVMDRDGSNQRALFPAEDRQGMAPQRIAWSPSPMENGHFWMALQYQGNLWLVDSETGAAMPVTGDGLAAQYDWK